MGVIRKFLNKLTYVRIIALGYLAVILLGTLLLMLPAASAEGKGTDFLTALFTATTSTCVTGLVVVDTGTYFSTLGHIFILLMMQIGGLGFVTMGILIALLLKKKITLRARELLQESMNGLQVGGIVRVFRMAFKGTMLMEAVGAVLLAIGFIPVLGLGKGLWYGIFHSVSAFCNGGIDLMGGYSGRYSSLTAFCGNGLVNITVIVLIVAGGIGFFVWEDIRQKKLCFRKYTLHSKMALVMTAVLLVAGSVLFYLFEKDGVLAGRNGKEAFLACIFHSATTRTAGFNTTDTGALTGASLLLTMVLMFIGGSPGSTAGGVKTVTMLVLLTYVWSNLRSERGVNLFGRRLKDEIIRKASNVMVITMVLVMVSAVLICFWQPDLGVEDVMFEVISAMGTAGMSTGITRQLNTASRVVIILLMYCGRIGGMSFALSFTERRTVAPMQLPAEKVMIG